MEALREELEERAKMEAERTEVSLGVLNKLSVAESEVDAIRGELQGVHAQLLSSNRAQAEQAEALTRARRAAALVKVEAEAFAHHVAQELTIRLSSEEELQGLLQQMKFRDLVGALFALFDPEKRDQVSQEALQRAADVYRAAGEEDLCLWFEEFGRLGGTDRSVGLEDFQTWLLERSGTLSEKIRMLKTGIVTWKAANLTSATAELRVRKHPATVQDEAMGVVIEGSRDVGHVEYHVVTSQHGAASREVWRRYSSFVTLHERLTLNGFKLPALPPKSFFNSEKVRQEREAGLMSFMQALTKDESLRTDMITRTFLGLERERTPLQLLSNH